MAIDLRDLPDVQQDDYDTFTSQRFERSTDDRIASIATAPTAPTRPPVRDDWASAPVSIAPTPSDTLTNPVLQGPSSAGPELSITPAPALPAPDAPAPTDFGPSVPAPRDFTTASDARIVSLASPPAQPSAPFPSPSPVGSVSSQQFPPDLVAQARNAAEANGIDPSLFVQLVRQESQFNPNAVSPAGARGLTQLMPATARGLGVTDFSNTNQVLQAGARYLKQNLDRFDGDIVRALAAYNAGPGNVEKYGGVPPFAETQKYVDSIIGGYANEANNPTITPGPSVSGQPVLTPGFSASEQPGGTRAPMQDISQFGDPQLTSDEAYAACGPAAAVRFAQRFGRNPTLREATDLARQVGWTPGQGMAGLGSEKALMDKLGVPTKLIQGAQWDVFAREAQTGNPVTISMPGHYFTADGFDPTTGKFHVGKSGLDLKGGAEWMSPADMQRLMGQVQGGLLADNPQVPAPSTADQDSNPMGFLGRAKDALTSGWNTVTGAVGDAASSLGSTVNDALSSPFASSVQAGQEAQTRGTVQAAEGIGNFLTEDQPFARNLVGAGTRQMQANAGISPREPGAQGLTPEEQYVQARSMATGLAQTVVPEELIARGATTGAGALSKSAQVAEDLARSRQRGEGINPFTLFGEPSPGRMPVSVDEAATHLEDLQARYASNDAQIREIENRLGTGAYVGEKGDYTGTVVRPPWAAGWTNDALAQVARENGVTAAEPLWWEKAGLLSGSGEVRSLKESAARRITGTTRQTAASARSELARLQAEQHQIMGAAEEIIGLGERGTFYRAAPEAVEDLPFAEYTPSRAESGSAPPPEVPARATETGGGSYTAPARTGSPPPPVSPSAPAAIDATPPGPIGGRYRSVMPESTFVRTEPAGDTGGIRQAVADVNRAYTRAFTDRQVDINQVQQAYAKALGRPLRADEMAAELQRLSADPAAQVYVDEGLKPAIRAVGDDYDALRDYVTLRSNAQVADALGNEARVFSGGLTAADSQARMAQLEAQLGPERFQKVKDAAGQVSDFSRQLRNRLVEADVLSREQASQMDALYPDWAKTRILDYMKDTTGGQGAGTKIGLSDRQLRRYTLEGTERAREDPLASMVAYAHQAERMARKNEAFRAFLSIDQQSAKPQLRKVAQDFTPTKDQVTTVGFVNGEKVKYVTDNKALGEAINGAGVMSVPEWTSAWQKVFRSLATSRNPLFLAGNAALDIPTYTFRSAIREGGPQALPRVLSELAKGYGDAFQGLMQGEFRGLNTARLMKGGGGQAGYFTGDEGQAAQTVASLRRSNVFEINGKGDLLRLTKGLVTLEPVQAVGERIELGPRVAAMRLAERRGANPVQAVIDGRTVTVDFSQGGTVTKYINNYIPFFNVGFQGPAQLPRAFRDNPRAFAATVGTLIGIPTIAVEAWNRSDPQRAKDYADVPQYAKDQGVVIMLPGEAPMDAQGNRKPLYAVIKLREWAPFASIARDATSRVLGDDSKSWAEMAASAAQGFSPTNASSVGQLGTDVLSGIPVLPAAAQLQFNKDFFRNRDIVTKRSDESASAAAKALAPVMQSVLDKFGIVGEVHPSAVDFFIRNQGAGVGAALLGASDLGKQRQDTSPTSLPAVGGLIGRFVGNQTGGALTEARGVTLGSDARRILRDNGITTTPGPVSGEVNGIPLLLTEETRYQQLANKYIDEAIHDAVLAKDWGTLTPQGRASRMQNAMQTARGKAGIEVLNTIGDAEKRRRVAAKTTAPNAPVPAGASR